MEGKRYSLRSGGGQQTKIEFPCRRGGSRSAGGAQQGKKKRQQSLAERKAVDENESPPKRTRLTGVCVCVCVWSMQSRSEHLAKYFS